MSEWANKSERTKQSEWAKKSCVFDDNDLIGQGAFSKVYKTTQFSSGSTETTAVKVYQKSKVNQEVLNHAKREQNILKNVQSQYICSYRQSLQSKNKFYMVQKLQSGTTLDKIIDKYKRIDPKEIIRIAKSILNGLEYLHSKRIMHRDIKPANIMYDFKTGKAVILDLGFATYFHKHDQKILTTIVGTPDYMSPQILLGKKYNSLSDIWSFGVILYEMLCGQLPFKGRSQKEIINSILSKSLVFKSNYNPTLEWIITNCLKIDASQRIRWEDLFQWKNSGKLQNKRVIVSRMSSSTHQRFRILSQGPVKPQECQCNIF